MPNAADIINLICISFVVVAGCVMLAIGIFWAVGGFTDQKGRKK